MYKLYKNIELALTLKGAEKKKARNITERDLSIVKRPVVLAYRNKIIWLGPEKKFNKELIKKFNLLKVKVREFDLAGCQIMPGFIECHTHSVFAGHRQDEFELRNQGVSYQEIANKGGGIKSTVKLTRSADLNNLKDSFKQRALNFKKQGVSVLEVKSGYGLSLSAEKKILRVIKEESSINTIATFLGPHACPKEFNSSEDYMSFILEKMLPQLLRENLVDRADIFIEKGYFTKREAKKYFNYLTSQGVPLSCHIDQLTNSRAISDLCQYPSLQSVDHLVCIDKKGIKQLAASEVTGVLLPLADFYLKMKYPPARELIDQGARVALATDFNPGSAPSMDLSLVGVLARLEMRMSLAEVICAYTLGAAYALGINNNFGSLTVGKQADILCLSDSYEKLFYSVGHHPIKKLFSSRF